MGKPKTSSAIRLNFSLWLGYYPYKIGFSIGTDLREAQSASKRLGIWDGNEDDRPSVDAGVLGCCWEREGCSMVWLPRLPYGDENLAVLTHECVHAVENAARHIGYGCSSDSEEFRAHAQGFLVSEVLKKCNRKVLEHK
jgi:hypothetical protein